MTLCDALEASLTTTTARTRLLEAPLTKALAPGTTPAQDATA